MQEYAVEMEAMAVMKGVRTTKTARFIVITWVGAELEALGEEVLYLS
jgi:hypothetical protein